MKRGTVFSAFLIMAVVLLLSGCLDSFKYVTVQKDEAEFSVDLPRQYAVLSKRTEMIGTEAGAMNMDFYLAYSKDKIFMVGVIHHGMPDIGDEFIFEGLKFARDMVALKATVIDHDEFYFNGRPAVSVRYKKKENGQDIFAHAVIMDIEGTQYQIQVASPILDALDDPEAVRFHMSFRYTGVRQERMNSLNAEVFVK